MSNYDQKQSQVPSNSSITATNPYSVPSPANYPQKDENLPPNPPPPPPPPAETRSKGDGFWRGCCAGWCCYCCLDACF